MRLASFPRSADVLLAALLALCPLAAQAQACVPGTWQSPPNTLWGSPNGDFPVQAESARFQIRWPADKPALLTPEQAQAALAGMERILDWFTGPTVRWPEPFCDSAVKHKVQVFTNAGYGLSGAGAGDRSPAMWVGPGALVDLGRGQSSGMVHEFTHAMQFHSRGMRNTDFGGWLWESHAEFMAHQYPGNPDKTGCTSLSAWMPHLYAGSTRVRYCNWQFWDHLKNKYGFAVVNRLFLDTAGQNGQDPYAVLMRQQGWSQAQLGDEFGQFAMRNVTWDYTDAQDGFNRGAAYRSAFGEVNDRGSLPDHSVAKRLRLARVDAIDAAARRYAVSGPFAPQRYGYNHVRLIPDAGAGSVSVSFRGVVQTSIAAGAEVGTGAQQPGAAPGWTAYPMPTRPASNWRWGLVAVDLNGNPRYSALQRGAQGILTMAVQPSDRGLYLVVAATPDEHHGIFWDQMYHTLYRYPYKLQLSGALPDGHQAGDPASIHGYPAGRRHPNGGGWVANAAQVDASAYVGPNAAVLGGRVLGAARIEDHAVVWNGTVQDQAIVGGLTQLNANLTVYGQARLHSVMAGGQSYSGGTALGGNAILFGDVESHLGTTPLTKGAFSGYIDAGMTAQASYGANRTAPPVEVTAPVPPGWPDSAAPTARLTTPTAARRATLGAVIAVAANAADADGSVARVELQDNGQPMGTAATAPYAWSWRADTLGSHSLVARAVDDQGNAGSSTAVVVTVVAPSATPPSSAVRCARENANCTLPTGTTSTVWYGARSSYRVLTGQTGSLPCTNSHFGDPLRGTVKACFFVAN